VDEAFIEATKELSERAPVLKEKPVIRHEVYDMNDNKINIEPFTFWEKIGFLIKGRKLN